MSFKSIITVRSIIAINGGLVALTGTSYLFPQMRYVSYGLGLSVLVGGCTLGYTQRLSPFFFYYPVYTISIVMGVSIALTGVVGAHVLPHILQHGPILLRGVKRVYELGL